MECEGELQVTEKMVRAFHLQVMERLTDSPTEPNQPPVV